MLLDGVDPDDRAAGHPRELGGVHLETQRREITQAAPAVGQDDQAWDWTGVRGRAASFTRCGHDAGFGQVDLIEQDQGVDLLGTARARRRASSRSIASGVGVQFLESSRFSSRGGRPGSITSGLQ